jgi:cobalt-zinc-cadmium efflux system membrane fusion protein
MNAESRLMMRWPVAVVAGIVLLASGAGAAYLLMRSSSPAMHDMSAMDDARVPDKSTGSAGAAGPATPTPTDTTAAVAGPLPDVTITLTQEAVERAGIEVAPVRSGGAASSARLPGVVEPNAYRQVVVTPLVSGRVTRVSAQLGERVRRGQTLAQVYSPELAEAQTRYISARAELEAHERELERTQQLVKIGAASRQDLERIHAEHTARQTEVQSARSRLELLGVSASALAGGKDVNATTNVPAPINGVVTEREANIGLNVDASTKLFTVVDLSTVWVVAEVYEKDFARVRVGSPATVTTAAYPDLVLQGRVSYIDPQVNSDTRTAKARVEVSNPRGELRLGMFAEVQVRDPAAATAAVIPRSAIQNVGDRQVVYLVNPKEQGKFVEREVRLGTTAGEEVEVLTGVRAGDVVVAEGSFFVRAERERLGLRPPPAAAAPAASPASAAAGRSTDAEVQTARVTVGEKGFEPARLSLKAGMPARVTFVRTTDQTCATAVALPDLNIRRDLPLNQPVTIDITPKAGELAFACGMNMFRGTIVAQ